MNSFPLADLQNSLPPVRMNIDRVGVRHLALPISVREQSGAVQSTVADVEAAVSLPAHRKGTHMSRFPELLEEWRQTGQALSLGSLPPLLEELLRRLEASDASLCFRFPFFRFLPSPITGLNAPVRSECSFSGSLAKGERPELFMELKSFVTTVCPCSKAISTAGAHGQRAELRLSLKLKEEEAPESFLALMEEVGSAPVRTILKRPDEKYVTETAYANPLFVEDVVRLLADKIALNRNVLRFRVEVESQESIHGHNAFARLERKNSPAPDGMPPQCCPAL